ncbi:four helix bundle protein [Taibaiella koreensis]|uniref:four helix bundle protein n=1 Tax=Taibaiella koreensis TaxID=1268548 RepID=UPI001F099DA1|nr:four helix bundle protein [Taibaiella koreensis]
MEINGKKAILLIISFFYFLKMQKEKIDNNPLLKLSFAFSLLVIEYCEILESSRKFVIANQLLKSGTAIGANAMEAQNAESKADFIHKIKIAAKEAEETQYWLSLCSYAPKYPDCTTLLTKLEVLHQILGKILSTSKRKNDRTT